MDVQITEEMINAGWDVLGLYDPEWDSSEEFLKNLYLVMREAEGPHVEPQ